MPKPNLNKALYWQTEDPYPDCVLAIFEIIDRTEGKMTVIIVRPATLVDINEGWVLAGSGEKLCWCCILFWMISVLLLKGKYCDIYHVWRYDIRFGQI